MKYLIILLFAGILISCGEDVVEEPSLVFKFKFDSNQERLDGFGKPSTMPSGHAGQSPIFNSISAHYIELAKDSLTRLGKGEILFLGEETTQGGGNAVDFSKASVVAEDETFIKIPISTIAAGNYEWIRVSLSYQNYDIFMDAEVNGTNYEDIRGTAASFIGFNTYISKYNVKDKSITVNGNKLQGYVGVETAWTLDQFQAPPGATTVPNPLFNTAPIDAGSCVVTGPFEGELTITGDETEDIIIDLSLSTNKSFEWKDDNANGKYDPLEGELVVDMGIRGLIPYVR